LSAFFKAATFLAALAAAGYFLAEIFAVTFCTL
jgi:hypothetical protein